MSSHPQAINKVNELFPKLTDADADFRFMALNDLYDVLTNSPPTFLTSDAHLSQRVSDGIVQALNDKNGEVQNMAVKCLKPLVTRIMSSYLPTLFEKLITLSTKESADSSVPLTGIRTVVSSFPRPIKGVAPTKGAQDAYNAISKALIPRLTGAATGKGQAPVSMLKAQGGVDIYAIDVLNEVVRCFGPMFSIQEIEGLQRAAMDVLDDDRTSMVVKKRAVVAISALASYFTDELLSNFVNTLVLKFRNTHLTADNRRILISIVGSLAKSVPKTFGPNLRTLGAFLFSPLGDTEPAEDDNDGDTAGIKANEIREAALIAIENCQIYCGDEMRHFTKETLDVGIRLLKYDPFYSDDMEEDDDEQMISDDDEDFEQDEDFSDDDDNSWKVRRCAAKLLHSVISSRANADMLENGTLYSQIAPVLIERFSEREENVRIEIVTALSGLIKRTTPPEIAFITPMLDDGQSQILTQLPTRKRRRELSESSFLDQESNTLQRPARTKPQESLAALTPNIIRGVTKLLKNKSVATKQAAVVLLRDLVVANQGGLGDYFKQIIDPVIEAVQPTSSGGSLTGVSTTSAASATPGTLRIEALKFISKAAETHAPSSLQPYLAVIVPGVVTAVKDKYHKTASEALHTVEQLVKVVAASRSDPSQSKLLGQLYEVAKSCAVSNDTDLEVRERAIQVIGVLLSRTTGRVAGKSFSTDLRSEALTILLERVRNETTRIASVRAIHVLARAASKKEDYSPDWVAETALELGANLRKSNRALRGASLAALLALSENPASQAWIDSNTKSQIIQTLTPLISIDDLHMLAPALIILTKLLDGNATTLITEDVSTAICSLVKQTVSGFVLDALLGLVKLIGEQGAGADLMDKLLKGVGVSGDPSVVGKVTGRLLVYGQPSVGIQVNDFVTELQSAQDSQRRALALTILGEAGLCMGSDFPLPPTTFTEYFGSHSDQVPLAAAIALGRAGSGNIEVYLPVILGKTEQGGSDQYLVLHSVKEILQNTPEAKLSKYSQSIWKTILSTTQTDDNKAVGAECIGKLVTIDPKTFLPLLKPLLNDKTSAVRGTVISAIRYTFTDTDEAYDDLLKPLVINLLTTMLEDSELENRRLGLTTLNSAARNKMSLIRQHLKELLPLVIAESKVQPSLIREVQMGPFKHKVDDGLEIRKSAYETIFALLETAYHSIDPVEIFDRIIAGLSDDHDIQLLCTLMLTKLLVLDPDETQRRLDSIADCFRATLSIKPKDNAVKQEIEKVNEAARNVLATSVLLNREFPAATAISGSQERWSEYWRWAESTHAAKLASIRT